MVSASPKIQKYFDDLVSGTKKAYEIANNARSMGFDPDEKVDIPLAANMAQRVVGLISVVAPQLPEDRLTQRIKELEEKYELLDWRVALKIAEEVAKEKFCRFKNIEEAMEVGIRVGFSYLTLGIVAAPLEGFIGLKVKKRMDGKEYVAIYYAGPIRGAGGTASATSVILADYVRTAMGYSAYDPTEQEVNRYVTEINDYHERVTNLQYRPSEDELRFLAKNIPIEINGDPTEDFEVSNYKDLPRVETNKIRGGICLVMAEGVAQKSPKLWIRLSEWGKNLNLNWDFLQTFLNLQKKVKAGKSESKETKITPNYTFIADLVAGRPVLSYPLSEGGFRLRYGRTHASGFSAVGVNPVTLAVFNNYIAIGTQLKTERPGKAASVTSCDTIEGPIVKLDNGSVIRLEDAPDYKKLIPSITEVLYLGDILVSYGDFSENGHKLVPAGYCEEWWVKELEESVIEKLGLLDNEKIATYLELKVDRITSLIKDCFHCKPTSSEALKISSMFGIPLHPLYTFFWQVIDKEKFLILLKWLCTARFEDQKIILPMNDAKRTLELIGVPHSVASNEFVIISGDTARILTQTLSLKDPSAIKQVIDSDSNNALELVNILSPVKISDKAGTFVGARMGRPEKAKMRKMAGSPHILFPVGKEGERMRSFQSALKHGKISAEFSCYLCQKCNRKTIYSTCEVCGEKTQSRYYCDKCEELMIEDECKKLDRFGREHGKTRKYSREELDIKHYFNNALSKLNIEAYPDLIKGVQGTSNKHHITEHLAKGILRSKHSIYVNKDGTTRYDMTELPLTHFSPKEVGTSIEKLRELGYTHDVHGKELTQPSQVLELKPQDIVLPSNENSLDESSKKVLSRVAAFVDDLLVRLYNQKPFYNVRREEDIVGHLVIGLAPHISAGLIGRIIGFSETQGCFAHPLWHAGLRRDCDGDECCVMLLMDALLNFSRKYLPDQRGAKTMDSPLVLTNILIPSEVDDQSHGLDVCWDYPLELYRAALEYKNPKDVKIDQIKHHLGKESQYEGFGYTHPSRSLNLGVKCSSYKTIPTMAEKLSGQMEIAKRLRAVKESDVAKLVIEKHFIKDIKGNLRKFSMQQFRCVGCNQKFRRPPLLGKCPCGGKIIFTISEGSIIKYLQPSIDLASDYHLPEYLTQTLDILKNRVEGLFGRDKEKQSALGSFSN